jgi:hypothetical protein
MKRSSVAGLVLFALLGLGATNAGSSAAPLTHTTGTTTVADTSWGGWVCLPHSTGRCMHHGTEAPHA